MYGMRLEEVGTGAWAIAPTSTHDLDACEGRIFPKREREQVKHVRNPIYPWSFSPTRLM